MSPPDVSSLVLILLVSSLAAIASRLHHRLVLPSIVVEIALGILIGPEVFDFAETDPYIEFLSTIGLVFLFFFAASDPFSYAFLASLGAYAEVALKVKPSTFANR